jgi:hypothetical protein
MIISLQTLVLFSIIWCFRFIFRLTTLLQSFWYTKNIIKGSSSVFQMEFMKPHLIKYKSFVKIKFYHCLKQYYNFVQFGRNIEWHTCSHISVVGYHILEQLCFEPGPPRKTFELAVNISLVFNNAFLCPPIYDCRYATQYFYQIVQNCNIV